jgi:hypothetical protein
MSIFGFKVMRYIENSRFRYVLIGLPMFVFSWCLLVYAVNVPWLDDFEVAPLTLFRWLHEVDFQRKMALIWVPNNEHRVVTLKLLTLFNYYVFGQMNIQWMIWQSHLYLIALFGLIWRILPRENRLLYFLPVPFLYLNLQYYLASFWMIAGVQHNLVIGFGAISMYLLAKSKHFIWAVLFTLLASLSNSDGLFFIGIGALVLFLQYRFKELWIWLGILISVIFLFFWKYPSMSYHEAGMSYFKLHPWESLQGFFVFMGGGFDFWYREQSAFRLLETTMAGSILVGIIMWILIRFISQEGFKSILSRWRTKTLTQAPWLFVSAMLLFCLMNAVAISLLRSSFGEFVFLIGNYKIYPTLALVFVYLLMLLAWQQVAKRLTWVLVFSIVFWGCSFWNSFRDVQDRKRMLVREYDSIRAGRAGLGFTAEQQAKFRVAEILIEFESKGIYHVE